MRSQAEREMITMPQDLFAGADPDDRLRLAYQGLIDLSIDELLDTGRRSREEAERLVRVETNLARRAKLKAMLAKADEVRAANVALARAMLEKVRKEH